MFTFLAEETASIVNNSQLYSDHFCFSSLTKLVCFFFWMELYAQWWCLISFSITNLIKVIA